jgi:hypothetical protein
MCWSPFARGWDYASLAASFSTMAMTQPSDLVVDFCVSYHTTFTTGTLFRSHLLHSSHTSLIIV